MPSSACQTCALDRKSTRLNSSHTIISYAVFCLKKTDERKRAHRDGEPHAPATPPPTPGRRAAPHTHSREPGMSPVPAHVKKVRFCFLYPSRAPQAAAQLPPGSHVGS